MDTVFIEASEGSSFNWGKFMVGRLTLEEIRRKSALPNNESQSPLLYQIGFDPTAIFVFDMQTCEGAYFHPSRSLPQNAKYDLDKHKIWVCPMFEPFLIWLYAQDISDLNKLPRFVNLGTVPTAMAGYRRKGKVK